MNLNKQTNKMYVIKIIILYIINIYIYMLFYIILISKYIGRFFEAL